MTALLVSVRNAVEARCAIDGGCEILDVKEPTRGSLGRADAAEIAAVLGVRDECASTMPVSVALGEVFEAEAADWSDDLASLAAEIHFLKLGTARLGISGDWQSSFLRARREWESRLMVPLPVIEQPNAYGSSSCHGQRPAGVGRARVSEGILANPTGALACTSQNALMNEISSSFSPDGGRVGLRRAQSSRDGGANGNRRANSPPPPTPPPSRGRGETRCAFSNGSLPVAPVHPIPVSESHTPAPQWVAVAYADWKVAESPPPAQIVSGAADCGCSGLLIDTFTKSAGGLFDWLTVGELQHLAMAARERGLWFALAGRLVVDDLTRIQSIAPDIIGIRSAACRGRRRDDEIDPNAVRAFRCRMSTVCPT
jgi:uncharacterized protein (UPF0264 family)